MNDQETAGIDFTTGMWCVLELFGHRRISGWVTTQEIAGSGFIRIDIPKSELPDPVPNDVLDEMGGKPYTTQFYSPSAVYAITPTTEEIARGLAVHTQPAPVSRWELPAPTTEHSDIQISRENDLTASYEGSAYEHADELEAEEDESGVPF